MTRTKTVFGSHANLAHVWAQQTHDYGRSGDGRIFFHGATLYSYGTHYAIARFTETTFDGKRVVLFNSEGYSISTAKHRLHAQRALHGLNVRVFYVPFVGNSDAHADNATALLTAWAATCVKLAKPQTVHWRGNDVEARVQHVADYAQDLLDYDRAFFLGESSTIYDAIAQRQQAVREAFTKYNDPKTAAKRERAHNRRLLKYSQAAAQYYAWQEGVFPTFPGIDALPQSLRNEARNALYASRPYQYKVERLSPTDWLDGKGASSALIYEHSLPTLVRRVGDRLETSRGAVVPWQHAVVAFLRAQRCRQTNTSWQRNGGQVPVGHYQLDSIDHAGNITAGCHRISWDEMLRLAVREIPELVAPTYPLPIAA